MSQNNRRDDIAKSAATVALGAAVGYGCYKLFQLFNSKEEPHTSNPSNHGVIQPRPIPFSSSFPPSFPKDLKIYLIDSMDEFRYAIREIKSHCEEYNVLGFDCEWIIDQYGVRQNVALVQLASHRGLCVLIRLCEFGKIPTELQELLEDQKILKVGVDPFKDALHLFEDFSDGTMKRARSTLDLRYVSNLAQCFDGQTGLGKMSEKYLGVKLDKNTNVRCSNWNALSLNSEQIEYAAKDALVAMELFKYFAEIVEPKGFFNDNSASRKNFISKCIPYMDTNYIEKKGNFNKKKDDWVLLN